MTAKQIQNLRKHTQLDHTLFMSKNELSHMFSGGP